MKELLIQPIRDKVQSLIDKRVWILFNPDDPECISDDEFIIYESYVDLVKEGFKHLDIKKQQQGRVVKRTSNIGEIDSLAAAMLISANYICSNDYDIREVIQDEKLSVSLDEHLPPVLIEQDTIEDICYLCVEMKIASKKEVRQFFKYVYSQDTEDKKQSKLAILNIRLGNLS